MKAADVAAVVASPSRPLADALTLSNVSALYRHKLLATLLHVPIPDLADVFELFGYPFTSPEATQALLRDWGTMEDSGFAFRQLNYLIQNRDDRKQPSAPAERTILQNSKTLYDGLNAIDQDHRDVPPEKKDEATADSIRVKAGLLYESSVVEQIINLLEGTSVYTTNAPPNLPVAIPETDALAQKIKYNNQKGATPPNASIQVTGILTAAESTRAKTLSNDPGWPEAIDRAGKQALQFFNNTLIGVFPADKQAEAKATLLAGDVSVPPAPANPAATVVTTPPDKRFYFLRYFLPFLRQRLAHRLIVSTLSSATGLANDITDVLLTDVLKIGPSGRPALAVLEQIHQKPVGRSDDWKGYLIPTVDDAFTFISKSLVGDKQPPAIVIDGLSIPFTVQQEDPTNVWSSDPANPRKLKSGKLYGLEVKGQPADGLQWRTAGSPSALIPASVLLPDYSSSATEDVFVKLFKAALVINGFNMTVDEVGYWHTHGVDFADAATNFDFNAVTLGHWRRLQAYASLRDKLPRTDTSLLDLFTWAATPDAATTLSTKIAAATRWEPVDIAAGCRSGGRRYRSAV
jgi:hypothetical protein